MTGSGSKGVLDEIFGPQSASHAYSLMAEARSLGDSIGLQLPEFYCKFLCVYEKRNGKFDRNFSGFRFLKCAEIFPAWRSFIRLDGGEDEVDFSVAGDVDFRIRRIIAGRARLPIAEFNGVIWIFLDCDPAPGGVAGQVIQVDVEALNWYWLADSFEHLLEEIVDGRSLNPDMGTQDEDE